MRGTLLRINIAFDHGGDLAEIWCYRTKADPTAWSSRVFRIWESQNSQGLKVSLSLIDWPDSRESLNDRVGGWANGQLNSKAAQTKQFFFMRKPQNASYIFIMSRLMYAGFDLLFLPSEASS